MMSGHNHLTTLLQITFILICTSMHVNLGRKCVAAAR